MDKFKELQSRLDQVRSKSKEYGDAESLEKAIEVTAEAILEAAKAAKICEVKQVKSALEATQRSADVLAYNILFCDTSEVTPQQLLSNVVKFQSLEQIRGAFEPVVAEALLEGLEKAVEEGESEVK